MGYRAFVDDVGRDWEAWDVQPRLTERRRVEQGAFNAPDRRRRDSPEGQARSMGMMETYLFGWLCFQSIGGKRRLSPIPEGWEVAPIKQLIEWLKQAVEVPKLRECAE